MKAKDGMQKIFFYLFLSLLLLGFSNSTAQDTLILGVHPYLPQKELIQRFTPLAKFLSKKTGVNFVVKVGNSYAEHIKNIGLNKIDVAYISPAEYVKLTRDYGYQRIIGTIEVNGKTYFKGKIIALKSSPIFSIKDLIGKTCAFVQKGSTVGFVVPAAMLANEGIRLESLKYYNFVGTHENAVYAVLTGDYDAAAVKDEVYFRYKNKGLKIIDSTPPIPEHLFLAKRTMNRKLYKKIKAAFFSLNNSKEGLAILKNIQPEITGIRRTNDKNYDSLRKLIETFSTYER